MKVFNTDLLEMLAREGLLPNVLWKNLTIITYIISPMTRCHHRVTRNDPVQRANNYIMMRQCRKLCHIGSSFKEFIASQALSWEMNHSYQKWKIFLNLYSLFKYIHYRNDSKVPTWPCVQLSLINDSNSVNIFNGWHFIIPQNFYIWFCHCNITFEIKITAEY